MVFVTVQGAAIIALQTAGPDEINATKMQDEDVGNFIAIAPMALRRFFFYLRQLKAIDAEGQSLLFVGKGASVKRFMPTLVK